MVLSHTASTPVRRVSVRPLENTRGDTSAAYFGRTAARVIAEGLARMPFITVVDSGADLEVSGDYYVLGDSMHAQLQVADLATRQRLASSITASASRTTPFLLLDTLGKQVLATLAPRLDPRIAQWRMGALPSSWEAYNEFVEGLDSMIQGNADAAVTHWRRAAALDSTYMQPRLHAAATLAGPNPSAADTLLDEVERRGTTLRPGDRALLNYDRGIVRGRLDDALQAAEAFVTAEPGLPFPQFFLSLVAVAVNHPKRALEAASHVPYQDGRFRASWAGWFYFLVVTEAHHQLRDHRRELDAARTARALHPESQAILALEIRALAALRDTAGIEPRLDTLEAMPPTRNTPPVSSILLTIAGELTQHGDSAHADRVLRRVLQSRSRLSEDDPPVTAAVRRFDRGRALYFLGRYAEATALFDSLGRDQSKWLALVTLDKSLLAFRAATAHRLGKPQVANQITGQLDSLRSSPYDHGLTSYAQAQVAAQRGDTAAAIESLARALSDGAQMNGRASHNDLMLAPLWKNPRFQEMLRPKG